MEKNKIKISSNKSFGIVFFIFFLIISIYPLFNGGNIRIWLFFFSIVFLILGLLNSKILSPLNKIWFKFGILLGNVVSPIIMGVVFFLIVTPISITMKLFGKNFLNLKKDKKKTYWIKKNEIKSRMDNQF